MRVIGKILMWMVGILVGLIVLLLASVGVDAVIGGSRLDPLTNTVIPQSQGPAIRAFVARPTTPGPHPAVIMIHEWWGLKPEIVGKAQALAEQGYVVVAPDVFRGSTTSWIPRAIWQVATTPATQVDADLASVFDWLSKQPDVQAERIGIMGFCFGGGTSIRYSLSNPQIAATAVFYGSPIADVERLKRLNGPVLGIFGGADTMIPVTEVRAFEAALIEAGITHEISIYDGQPHAFVGGIEEIRQGGAPQQAWNQLVSFFDQSLKGQPGANQPTTTNIQASIHSEWSINRAIHLFVCDPAVQAGL